MKIKEKDGLGRILDVYAIYWVNGVRYHLVIPYREYRGLIVVPSGECEIISPSIDGFIVRTSSSGRDILLHWSVSEGSLLDRLIDPPDEDAMIELERRLKSGRPASIDLPTT